MCTCLDCGRQSEDLESPQVCQSKRSNDLPRIEAAELAKQHPALLFLDVRIYDGKSSNISEGGGLRAEGVRLHTGGTIAQRHLHRAVEREREREKKFRTESSM